MVAYSVKRRGFCPGIVIGFAVLAGGAGALSNDGGGSWQYYRDISINNTGVALTDYQVLVNLTGAAFPTGTNASGEDIRFTNSAGTELPFWIEEWNSSAQKAMVWVNVTSIPTGVSAVRMWWGNAGAGSASNIRTTFIFGDDFEYDDAISNHGWTDTRSASTSTDYASTGMRSFKATDSWIRIQNYSF